MRDNNGNVIDDTTHTVTPGIQQLILNFFDCPVGTNLQLGTNTNNTGLFRNNSGANYPYDIGGALSITESSAGSPGYYYYYYNIQVEIPCILLSSWDCDGQGNCFDPGTGNGLYSSLSSCQSSCLVPSWDCDGQVIVLILERETDCIVHYRLVNQVV